MIITICSVYMIVMSFFAIMEDYLQCKRLHWCDVFLLIISVISCIKIFAPLLIVFEIIQIFVIAAVYICSTASLWELKWRIMTLICPMVLLTMAG